MTSFATEIRRAHVLLRDHSREVWTEKWQGTDISKKPEMATHEYRHLFFRAPFNTENLNYLKAEIQPNLPWADNHFEERVCGQPINPGVEWKNWPYGHSAAGFLDKDGKFNHNYMERYWPKEAGMCRATETAQDYAREVGDTSDSPEGPNGIYGPYGDLRDVVKQLAREPLTRQAILPIFFPEDTGAVHGSRVPCSLAYQFFMRDNKIDVSYWLRSCDYRRHFRDDIYLTARLLLWVLQEVRKINPVFNEVKPGEYVMLITSLHLFANDYREVFRELQNS